MKKIYILAFVAIAVLIPLFAGASDVGNMYCANGSTMTASEVENAVSKGWLYFTFTNGATETTVHINNTTPCSFPAVLASYKAFQEISYGAPGWLSTQQFFQESSQTTVCGNTVTNISVETPSCKAQVDLWYQYAPHQLEDSDPYHNSCALPFVLTASITSLPICTSCTSHASTQCVNNSIYWFNSCGSQEELFQACTANQSCQSGQCVNLAVACSTNSQCGSNGYIGDPFCKNGNVYKSYKTYTCNNAGTPQSFCSNEIEEKLQQTCSGNQTCSSGQCINQNIACSTNSECGSSGYTGSPFCRNGNVYRTYRTYTCLNAGTSNSRCKDDEEDRLQENCSGYQTCSNGSCSGSQNIECSSNYDCGYNSFSGSSFCKNNSVYRNYKIYTCIHPGTTSSYCNNITEERLQENCSGYQTCSNGSCYGNQQGCSWHSYQRCLGNYLYWYDSCGNQQENIYCQNGCYNNSCQNYNYNYGNFTVNTTVRNLTQGGGFSSVINARPLDMLMFMITIQTNGNQTLQNVMVRDYLPSTLIYQNQLVVSGGSYYNYNNNGNITNGINIGSISSGQTVTITYQAQVAAAQNFSYGTTTLTNNASATASNGQNSPASSATIYVTRSAVYGASTISTGFIKNFLADSFILPLIIMLMGIWLAKAGMLEKFLQKFYFSKK